jgi:GIY-YIG catalytic domain
MLMHGTSPLFTFVVNCSALLHFQLALMKTKKDLKEEYRQMKFRIGVFQLRNTANDKIFIGSSVNLDAMWNRLRMQLNAGLHPNAGLQSDWQQYGEQNFGFEVLSELEQKDDEQHDYAREVKELEKMYIDELQPFGDKGYNR